jgi:hypothetical protein
LSIEMSPFGGVGLHALRTLSQEQAGVL